jgi:hypothetical protein
MDEEDHLCYPYCCQLAGKISPSKYNLVEILFKKGKLNHEKERFQANEFSLG